MSTLHNGEAKEVPQTHADAVIEKKSSSRMQNDDTLISSSLAKSLMSPITVSVSRLFWSIARSRTYTSIRKNGYASGKWFINSQTN